MAPNIFSMSNCCQSSLQRYCHVRDLHIDRKTQGLHQQGLHLVHVEYNRLIQTSSARQICLRQILLQVLVSALKLLDSCMSHNSIQATAVACGHLYWHTCWNILRRFYLSKEVIARPLPGLWATVLNKLLRLHLERTREYSFRSRLACRHCYTQLFLPVHPTKWYHQANEVVD